MSYPARKRSTYDVARDRATASWQPAPDFIKRRVYVPEMEAKPASFADAWPGEDMLRLAVVKQALADANGTGCQVQPWQIEDAQRWLHSAAFLVWCELVGLPGEAIVARYEEREGVIDYSRGHR